MAKPDIVRIERAWWINDNVPSRGFCIVVFRHLAGSNWDGWSVRYSIPHDNLLGARALFRYRGNIRGRQC